VLADGLVSLSRLMLGTAQLGLSYGIANRTGQPSYETARDILKCAYDGGVNCFDTAATYGVSEEVLGKALSDLGIADKVVVVSKITHMADELSSPEAAHSIIEDSVMESLRRLKLDVLPVCLFHVEDNFRYVESLLRLRRKGLVRYIGSSTATPDGASAIVASGLAEAVQIPTSVLDQRFIRSGVCDDARKRGVAAFARSIYLQGVLLMPEADIIPELSAVIPVRRNLQRLADEAGLSIAELAVRYVLSIDGVTCAVVGVETVEQMRENTRLFAKGPLDRALVQAIADSVPELPESVLNPRKWSKRVPDAKLEKR